jgi:hypothetical protein
MSNSKILCCPANRVDWNKEGGICCCNLPCDVTNNQILVGWYVDEVSERVIVPDQMALLPGWILLIPCVWLNFLFFAPICHAKAFIFYYQGENMNVDLRTKYACFETVEYTRAVSEVGLEYGKTFFGSETAALVIYAKNGAIEKGKVVTLSNPNDKVLLQSLTQTVNSRLHTNNASALPPAFVPYVPAPVAVPLQPFETISVASMNPQTVHPYPYQDSKAPSAPMGNYY